jgi:hypothetical protein
MPRKKQPGAHPLQQAIESQLSEFTSPPMLFALLVEMKLRKSRVRLSADERKRLQAASKEFLATGDAAILSRAVNRKRMIQISISPKDLPQFEKIFTKTMMRRSQRRLRRLQERPKPTCATGRHSMRSSCMSSISAFRLGSRSCGRNRSAASRCFDACRCM